MEGNRGPGEAGPSGFRNLEPLSREQRAAARDKDTLEKTRIQGRRRGLLQPPENVVGNPVIPPRHAPAYCDEYDRFNRDVAGEVHLRKQQSLQKKEELYASKRAEYYNREHKIWASDTAAEQRVEARYEAARSAGTGARRNQSVDSVNIITLSPVAPPSAQDTAALERRQVRAAHLFSKSHSVSHNIITGQPVALPAPAKPQY